MSRGFTLLELSIVLIIIALVTGMAVTSGISVVATARQTATQNKMKAIDDALMAYRTANDRIPCPADLTIAPGGTNYGVEGATPGTCTGGTPAANFTASGVTNTWTTMAEGAVPTATLGLPEDFMLDGWGNRIRYAVDISMTTGGAFVSAGLSCSSNAITINDANGTARSTGAVYALISHGANGHGAYTQKGVTTSSGSHSADELTNCHCTNAGVTSTVSGVQTTHPATYVQKSPVYDSGQTGNASYYFDDIVTYKERWQMPTAWDALGCTNQYIYVSDTQNARIEKFNTSGSYISQISIGGSGNSNQGLAVDTGGNAYMATWNTNVVTKYNSSGTATLHVGTGYNGVAGSTNAAGSANGQLNAPWGVAVDGSGDIWVVDYFNNRVEEYSSSGAWVQSIGGPSPYTCETSPAGSSPSCASGSGNGQFSGPQGGIAIDGSHNIWVVDTQNSRVQEFNSSGTYQRQLGSYGTGNGNLINPGGIAIDGSGNAWVADVSNNRVQEYSSSGTWLATLGGTASACSACLCTSPSTCPTAYGQSYSGNGQFSGPTWIAIDSGGNIWVSDSGNNRVQKFSSSGTYLMSIGTGYQGAGGSTGSTGTGNGQFNSPQGIAITGR